MTTPSLPVVDFLGIGAQRTATTWLHTCLNHHPGVWLPPWIKEVHYFDRLVRAGFPPPPMSLPLPGLLEVWRPGSLLGRKKRRQMLFASLRGLAFGQRLGRRDSARLLSWWLDVHRPAPSSDAWYRRLFRPGEGRVKGEITPAYALLDEARVRHVVELFPDIGVIFTIRDPIARTLSALRYGRAYAQRNTSPIQLVESKNCRLRNDYLRTIDLWSAHIPPERLLVCWYDDLEADPVAFLGRILGFLGVDASPAAEIVATVTNQPEARNTAPEVAFPEEVLRRIAEVSRPGIAALVDRYGGHAVRWLERCDRTLGGDLFGG